MGQKNYLYKNSPWEESTKIPFNNKNTRQHAKWFWNQYLVDIFPTIIEMCNLKFETNKKANRKSKFS